MTFLSGFYLINESRSSPDCDFTLHSHIFLLNTCDKKVSVHHLLRAQITIVVYGRMRPAQVPEAACGDLLTFTIVFMASYFSCYGSELLLGVSFIKALSA